MKFKQKFKLSVNRYSKFYLSDDKLCFNEEGSIVILNNDLSLYRKIQFHEEVGYLQILNDELLILNDTNHPYLYSLKGDTENLINVKEDENLVPPLSQFETFDKFIVEKETETLFLYDTGIYKRDTGVVRYFDNKFAPRAIIDNRLIIWIGDNIRLFDEDSGTILWKFSVSDFPNYLEDSFLEREAEIKQLIGLHNNILWVFVGGWHLLGIDIDTGKKIHHIENIMDLLGMDDNQKMAVNFHDTMHLDKKTGVLKAFAFRFYFEIDLNTLQGRIIKDFGPNWNPDWRIRKSTYYQDYPDLLFFCGYYKLYTPNAFGVFDTVKGEIIWFDTTRKGLGYFYNPPQANDKLLAILDDEANLLVYDRKETDG